MKTENSNNYKILVPEDSSLQKAINNAPSFSTLYLPEKIYNESIVITKPITLIGMGSEPSARETCIYGNAGSYVTYNSTFLIKKTEHVNIERMAIYMGNAKKGGNCFIEHASVSFRDCSFKYGTAIEGGAVYAKDSKVDFKDCNLSACQCKNGAIVIDGGSASFVRCVFDENHIIEQDSILEKNDAEIEYDEIEYGDIKYTPKSNDIQQALKFYFENLEDTEHLGWDVFEDIVRCIETKNIDELKDRENPYNGKVGNNYASFLVWGKREIGNAIVATLHEVGDLFNYDKPVLPAFIIIKK